MLRKWLSHWSRQDAFEYGVGPPDQWERWPVLVRNRILDDPLVVPNGAGEPERFYVAVMDPATAAANAVDQGHRQYKQR